MLVSLRLFVYVKSQLRSEYQFHNVLLSSGPFVRRNGFYASQPKLDFDVVKNCAKATGLSLVMHGGSGVSNEWFKRVIENGIRKMNYYSYMSKAGYMAAKAAIESGKSSYLHDVEYAAMQAMKEDVKKAIKIFSQKKL